MNVSVIDLDIGFERVGIISLVSGLVLPSTKDGWKFNWSSLVSDNSFIYMLTLDEEIQGVLKMTKYEEGFYVMKNLEIAPHNFGSKGKYGNVAGCLIAYACLKSFEQNKGNYIGYLGFKSKGELIQHYQHKYFAELVYRDRMVIAPKNGKKLIKKYLKLEL